MGRTGPPGDPGPAGIPGVPTIVLWRNSREDWQTFTVSYSHGGRALGELHLHLPISSPAGASLLCWDESWEEGFAMV